MTTQWPTQKLGDLCDLVGGGTPAKDRKDFYGGSIPWATVRDMNVDLLTSTEHSLTEAGLESSSSHVIPAGSVVIATRVGLGKVVILAQDTAINQDLRGLVIRDHGKVTNQFLYWWYRSVADTVISAGTGATVQGVTLPFVSSLEVPVPPLVEQQRIVAKLEMYFGDLKLLHELRLRQISLAEQTAQSWIDQCLRPRSGWLAKPLDEWCAEIATGPFGSLIHKADYQASGVPLVNPMNMSNGEIVENGLRRVSVQKAQELQRYRLSAGDVVLARRGEMGRCAVVQAEHQGWICGTGSFVLRPQACCNPEMLAIWLSSRAGRARLVETSTGTTMDNLSNRVLGQLVVTLPGLETQKSIVEKVKVVERLQVEIQQVQSRRQQILGELRQSVLAAAFRGDL